MRPEHLRQSRLVLTGLLVVQAVFVAMNLGWPGWALIDLDQEHNLPTWFQAGLLAMTSVLALDVMRAEARFLGRTGRRRAWAAGWLVVTAGFAYLAADEAFVIHEGLLTEWLHGRLAPASPLQLTLAWLVIFLPLIVLTVAFLTVFLGARARLCPRLAAWGAAGLACWVAALTLEGTAKSFFIPRNLYWLEVILEETAEPLGTLCFAWGFWRYGLELRSWPRADAAPPVFAVPWRWVAAATLALALPIGAIGASIAWNPYALHRYLGDEHLRAGRLDEAVREYRVALAAAPGYGRAWYRLGVAELRRGNLGAAGEAFATAARLEPGNGAADNELGVVLFRQGRHREAAMAFARALARAPDDARATENSAVALRALGQDAEADAALARLHLLRPPRLQVTDLRVAVPVEVQLAWVADPRVDAALEETRAGRVEAAIAAYRRVLASAPTVGAAHLGLANELVRWRLAARLAGRGAPPGSTAGGEEAARSRSAALFSDWIRDASGGWSVLESVVEPPAQADDGALAEEARQHFREALALGESAPVHAGLAALARLEGDEAGAIRHLAGARAADPSFPPAREASTAAASR